MSYTYTLDGYHSYTSKSDLSPEEERGIAASQRPLPQYLCLPDGTRIDWQEEWRLAEKRTRAGYAVLENGIRIKYESSASPDYYKMKGCGSCTMWATIQSPIPLTFE